VSIKARIAADLALIDGGKRLALCALCGLTAVGCR
jgi:hypothetical protein